MRGTLAATAVAHLVDPAEGATADAPSDLGTDPGARLPR